MDVPKLIPNENGKKRPQRLRNLLRHATKEPGGFVASGYKKYFHSL
jgi:hypothetical protein